MAPHSRPTAFDVSFPEEAAPRGSGTTSLKRSSAVLEPMDSREAKRRLPPVAYYSEEDLDAEVESADLVLAGEDPFRKDDDDDDKPCRVLADFTIFDPRHRREMVPLSAIEEDHRANREFVGVGIVFPFYSNEEDEGQEDEDEEVSGIFVRLGAILRYTFDYLQDRDPMWIETAFAWYTLRMPSHEYMPYYQHFYTPRRIAQFAISCAKKDPRQHYEDFRHRFTTMTDPLAGGRFRPDQLLDARPEIRQALQSIEDPYDYEQVKNSTIFRRLLPELPLTSPETGRTGRQANPPSRHRPRPLLIKSLIGNNLDVAVLRPENQNPTHVTPRIASLAQGLVSEELEVIGAPPSSQSKAVKEALGREAHARLQDLVKKAKSRPNRPIVDIRSADYYGPRSMYLKTVKINGEVYGEGDFILVPIGTVENEKAQPPGFPDDIQDVKTNNTVADYFWFAKIVHGIADRRQFHVQWMEHSSHTFLEKLGHPQELFYNDGCDRVDFRFVVGKVTVHEDSDGSGIKPEDFFARFTYNPVLATFTSADPARQGIASHNKPPNNCPVCPLFDQEDIEEQDQKLKDETGKVHGVAYGGNKYHLDDFVLYRAAAGPADIGYIRSISFPLRETREPQTTLTVQLVGRISDLPDNVLPEHVLRDERHVYLTKETRIIKVVDLIRVCFVVSSESIEAIPLEEWLSLSSDNFYLKYMSASLEVKLWAALKSFSYKDLAVCKACVSDALKERSRMKEFLSYFQHHRLRTVDLFGGVGAFSTGLAEGSGCLSVTDLVEKSPSAALTTMRNHPDISVHNQCTNIMLHYTIKAREGHAPAIPKQLFDETKPISAPIEPAQCLIAGFPCQSHSRLNMYRKADDIKSNLILNALSWVDDMRPKLCYFENVPGFLGFSFDAKQAGLYKTEGGTEMGGLKFLVRALGDMGYQTRFALLQAAHYGTPQRRSRFFLIAAIHGYPLPEFPQPTHDFPEAQGLAIKLPSVGKHIQPIRSNNGTAPHPVVTIKDAISDLPRFDWKNPNLMNRPTGGRQVPAFACKDSSPTAHCGFPRTVDYHHRPKTTYQARARRIPTENLQQFTRCFTKKKVERVVSIPMRANADYRDLRASQHEWQVANPLSSVARANYRPGLYGRLDENSYFPTTVTNIEPTAKQSRVLNPWCKRMVTVRELARSQGFPDHFVFEALEGNVVTMHRQIGNAVPLPVGIALGRELRLALYRKWLKER